MKLSTSPKLAVADYFNMYNTVQESDSDEDLGSGGAMVLPDLTDNNGQVHHLAVGAGKDSNIYVVNRDNMGKFNPNNDNAIYQELDGVLPGGVWANPAYFNNTVYYGSVGKPAQGIPHQQCDAGLVAELPESHFVRISGNVSRGLGQRDLQRDRVGGGEQQSGGVARLRRHQSGA